MAVRGYVLIEAEVGHSKSVGEAVKELKHPEARVTSVDTVTGPYDVIVLMEADDIDKLSRAITDVIHHIQGVQRTVTCLAVRLG